MRLGIVSIALTWIMSTGLSMQAAHANAVEYRQINETRVTDNEPGLIGRRNFRYTSAQWNQHNGDKDVGCTLWAHFMARNDELSVASANVIEFNPPVALGSNPGISFKTTYLNNIFPSVGSSKPFLRVEYADGEYVTIGAEQFKDSDYKDGYYTHTLDRTFPHGNYPVKRIAIVARGNRAQDANFHVKDFKVGQIKTTRDMAIRITERWDRNPDPLLCFVYR